MTSFRTKQREASLKILTTRPTAQEAIKGISLLEVMIVTTILVIVSGYGYVSMTDAIQRKAVGQAGEKFMQAISLARKTAEKISENSILCPGDASQLCQETDWTSGWTLFRIDRNTADQSLIPISYYEGPEYGVKMKQTPQKIIINQDGFFEEDIEVTMEVCHPSHEDYWLKILLSNTYTQIEDHFYGQTITNCS